jgi:CDP-diacylglycerol--serine O-phosphatidyltransferase
MPGERVHSGRFMPSDSCAPTMKRVSRAQHVLADALTGCNLACGIAATLLPGEGRPIRRSTLILVGALCDTLDGPLARKSGNPTDFGAAADSISDVMTCGVAPAALLATCRPANRARLLRAAPGFYIAAAAWRLARYGIGHRTSHVFRGLPVTGAGIALAVGYHTRLPPRPLGSLALVLSAAMVSPIRVLSGEALIRRDLTSLETPNE